MNLEYMQVNPSHAEALVALERLSFPTAAATELLSLEGVAMQCSRFPEGGFVVIDHDADDFVAAFAMGCYVDFDLDNPQHTLEEVVGEFGSELHDPVGEWYYGTDIAVSPAYRGQGIGRALYDLRKALIKRDNRAGLVAGGVIPGYADHKHEMSAEVYVAKVVAGELYDPTLTMQLRNGFVAPGAIADYWRDDAVNSWASLIVWHNPDYDPIRMAAERASVT